MQIHLTVGIVQIIVLDILYFLVFDKSKSVTFCGSPGYVHNQGNKDVDKAAKLTDLVNFKFLPVYLESKLYFNFEFCYYQF